MYNENDIMTAKVIKRECQLNVGICKNCEFFIDDECTDEKRPEFKEYSVVYKLGLIDEKFHYIKEVITKDSLLTDKEKITELEAKILELENRTNLLEAK